MYKDEEKKREASAERMRRHRAKGVTEQGVTGEGVTLLHRPNSMNDKGDIITGDFPYNPEELMPDGTKRYMGPFSDGQVLDNTTVGLNLIEQDHHRRQAMEAWVTASLFIPNKYAQR